MKQLNKCIKDIIGRFVKRLKIKQRVYRESFSFLYKNSCKVGSTILIKQIRGIRNARKAFVGPAIVQLDITNRCNLNCTCCWVHSPLIKESPPEEWISLMLPFQSFKILTQDLQRLGTKYVEISGSGEPAEHPDLISMIEDLKRKGIKTVLTSNGKLLDKKTIKRLFELKIHSLEISISAGSPEIYVKTHPTQNEDTYWNIYEKLKYLSELNKKVEPNQRIRLIIINVIYKDNYQDIINMAKLGIDLKANSVSFVPIDVVEDTRHLLLTEQEIKKVNSDLEKSRLLLYSRNVYSSIPTVSPRINKTCALEGKFDEDYYNYFNDKNRCYVGWVFSRIVADGSVKPCLNSDLVLGNINTDRFINIWNSLQYCEFREKAKNSLTDPLFRHFNCFENCFLFQINRKIDKVIDDYRLNKILRLN